MKQVITIGLGVAMHVFQVHGIDAAGEVLIRRKLRRSEILEFFGKLPRACRYGGVRNSPLLGRELG